MGINPTLNRNLSLADDKRNHQRTLERCRVAANGSTLLIELGGLLSKNVDANIGAVLLRGVFGYDLQRLLAKIIIPRSHRHIALHERDQCS